MPFSGLGGSGKVDPTVTANANVAFLSATAATALFIVRPIFDQLNCTGNGAFVIALGTILGVRASFLWAAQGAIMTTYVPNHFRSQHSTPETVSGSTNIALLVIMAVGWLLEILICPPGSVRIADLQSTPETDKNYKNVVNLTSAEYRQWDDIRYPNPLAQWALYWMPQVFGGLVMCLLLDVPRLGARARWPFLFVTGMAIWGGGYAFQLWSNRRMAQMKKQDIDFTGSHVSVGRMLPIVFYGWSSRKCSLKLAEEHFTSSGSFCVAAAIFSFIFVLDTSGKSLEQIATVFGDHLGDDERDLQKQVERGTLENAAIRPSSLEEEQQVA
ncbi:hypothetical protein BBP40_000330 [Aspergillus hancockii]|nr:hypothetical protein BBP40_000330 [Aspergillus hancockii]